MEINRIEQNKILFCESQTEWKGLICTINAFRASHKARRNF